MTVVLILDDHEPSYVNPAVAAVPQEVGNSVTWDPEFDEPTDVIAAKAGSSIPKGNDVIAAKAGSNPYKGYGVVAARAGRPYIIEESDDEPPECPSPRTTRSLTWSERKLDPTGVAPLILISCSLIVCPTRTKRRKDFLTFGPARNQPISARVENPVSFEGSSPRRSGGGESSAQPARVGYSWQD